MALSPRIKVAIVGAGIGGLTAAVVLCQSADIHIDIYESSGTLAEVGAGVGMWKRTWNIMQTLGLSDDLTEMFGRVPVQEPTPVFRWRKSDDPKSGVEFFHLIVPFGQITFHRADFHYILIKHSSKANLHLGKKLQRYEQMPFETGEENTESIKLFFEDGTSSNCDVLIGADGIHSRTRKAMVQDFLSFQPRMPKKQSEEYIAKSDPFWTGAVAYRGVFPKEILEAKCPGHRATLGPYMWCGKNGHIVSFLVCKETLINVVAFRSKYEKERTPYPGSWVTEVSQDELLSQYEGWEPDVITILQCLEKPSRWAVHAVDGLPTYSFGRVALLGDAAHAMTPHQGSGGGQSIEDAYILASLLSHPRTTRKTLPKALAAYDKVRRPLAQSVLENSRETGFVFEFKTKDFDGRIIKNEEDLADLKRSAERLWPLWKWAWTGGPQDDLLLAERLFQEMIDNAEISSIGHDAL